MALGLADGAESTTSITSRGIEHKITLRVNRLAGQYPGCPL